MSDIFTTIVNTIKKKSADPGQKGLIKYGIIILVLIILGRNVVYSIDQKEIGILTRFGAFHTVSNAGLHFKLPFIDRLYRVPQTMQSLEFGYRTASPGVKTSYSKMDYSNESRMLTGDLNIIELSFVIQYLITDARDWLFNVASVDGTGYPSRIEYRIKTIRDVSTSVVNRYVGNNYAENVQERGVEMIAIPAREEINKILRDEYNLGITLQNVNLNQVVYNEIIQRAIEDVNAAEQDRDRLINEGQEAYNKEIPKVYGQAEQIVQQAEGAVSRFNALYDEYRQNPEIFRQRYYYETLEKVLTNGSERLVIVDKDLDNFLPLKTLPENPPILPSGQ